jgi:hypothetical protein
MRNPFASDKRQVNGSTPPPTPRVMPRAPMLPMAMPEQQPPAAMLHPTTHALAQLDAALQEIRRLEGHIEGQDTIMADLRRQLKESRRDREMYRGFSVEIGTHLAYVMDAAKEAHSCAMKAAERSVALEAEQQEMPRNLDEVGETMEEQLREATASVQAAAETAIKEGQQ